MKVNVVGDRFYSTRDLMDRWGVSRWEVQQRVRHRGLRAIPGARGEWIVRADWLDDWETKASQRTEKMSA